MHDGGAPLWREIVEAHKERLLDDLAGEIGAERARAIESAIHAERESAKLQIEAERESARRERENTHVELDRAAAKARTAARQSTAEALNQALRRIRQANSQPATLELLAELSGDYAPRAVVLVFENHQAKAIAQRGVSAASAALNGSGSPGAAPAPAIALENAPALQAAIESRDPVTVLGRESEVSSALAHLLGVGPADRLYLFPVIARHHVVAMLAGAGEVFSPALELLAEASGMRLESVAAAAIKESPARNLVSIQAGAIPASATSERRAWDDLNPEDQKLHLQAQRMARVRVAKMRLEREDAWRRGIAQSDIYSALRRDIESARTEFLQTFLSKSSTMVDYLHLEILRSLANDDDRVLGREYPGPMV